MMKKDLTCVFLVQQLNLLEYQALLQFPLSLGSTNYSTGLANGQNLNSHISSITYSP